MKTFKEFLQSKGILEDDFSKKNADEMAKLYSQYTEECLKAIKTDVDGKASKDDVPNLEEAVKGLVKEDAFKKLETTIKEQGIALTKLKEKGAGETKTTLAEEIKKNKVELVKIAKGDSSKEIVLKADTLRASIASNSQAYELADIGQLAHRKLTLYDIFPKFPVSESNNNGVIRYWDWDSATIVRAAAAKAEATAFPESTAKWVQGTIALQKIGDTLPVSEEFEEDEAMFAAELNQFLDTNVAIKVDTDLANANGTAPNIKGIVASVDAYTAAASGITDANIYDLLVKVSESITTTGGSKYAPDFALMNIADINKMKLKKDGNNNYIIPPFVSRDGRRVDTIVVLEANVITANTMIMGDRRFARIYEKGGVVLSKGYSGTQFVEDMMTLKARKRLAFLIRGADKGGFAKVTSISAALTTLAT